jgi:hypothetical protein
MKVKRAAFIKYKALLAILLIALTYGCEQNEQYIEKVKGTYIDTLTGGMLIKHLVSDIAGIQGAVEWKVFNPTEYKNSKCVQVDIVRNKKVYNLVKLQFLINIDTDLVNLAYMAVDEKILSFIEFEETRGKMKLADLEK